MDDDSSSCVNVDWRELWLFFGNLTPPSPGTCSVRGELSEAEDESAGELSLARLAEGRIRRKGDFFLPVLPLNQSLLERRLRLGDRRFSAMAVLLLRLLSEVSVLVRSTVVSMVGGLGFRRNLGILSIVAAVRGASGPLQLLCPRRGKSPFPVVRGKGPAEKKKKKNRGEGGREKSERVCKDWTLAEENSSK